MRISFRKQQLPWLMAAARALLGPILILGQLSQWSGAALASLIFAALISDIFDGILARRWHCDTPAVRLFDSMADTAFYLCTAAALWLRYPHLWSNHIVLFGSLLTLEATRFLYDFAKFGKPSSYHSYLAKAWGLLLAVAVMTAFLTPHADVLISAALLLGILCDLEGFTMSILLRTWHRDVKTLRHACELRTAQTGPSMATPHAQLTEASLSAPSSLNR
jgi:phosphatidylglycerophosphate synthase